ncbi:zinc finger protein 791-like isoform X9 [Cataglyphis hispanica]|uniref:zinc finger protein 791-like isoform X9 n=1 Tax=Cataglyphis hispanica TaxID=1086592 RepID=UPI00217FE1BC|nr:zinc finger protein 791-like isoform X9 [Cataglyphis hispanica]
MSSLDYLDLCRLCLVKDRVSVPIFEGEGDVRQIFLKITACLPVKVAREDKLPKKICDDCVYKVELIYQFWHTTANAEKQLLQWLGEVNMEDKQSYVGTVLNPNGMKPEQSSENRLDGTVMQQVGEHQNNMTMGMMDNMGLTMPMMMSSNTQQQITSVPIDNSGSSVQNVQPVAGPSTQTSHDQITQDQTNASTQQEEEEESSEEEENSDDECDGDEGLPIKEESEEDPNNRTLEPTTFVNVSLACDEAGPSGLQQQKIADMPEMVMSQTSDVDPKTGCVMIDIENTKLESIDIENTKLESIDIENTKLEPIDELQDIQLARYQNEVSTAEEYHIGHQEIVTETVEYMADDSNDKLEESIMNKDVIKSFPGHETSRKCATIYECEICGKQMLKKLQFLKHRQDHKRNPKTEDRCEECDKVFANEEKLRKHMIKAHQKEKPFQCVLCGKYFKTEEFLKIHLKQHNKRFTCDICGISKVSGYDLRLHKKKHNQEYVTHCEMCGKGFYTNQTLERHLLTHTGEKPFVCKVCNIAYASAAYLNMHMKSHGEREKHKCNICNFESYWKAALKVHLKIHTGENQITCEICGKSVSSKTYLQIHMRIHSGEKPHVCEVCGKAFSVRKYLIVHLRTHTGERPYECKVCQKRFTQQGSLNSHIKSHNESK